MTQNPLNTIKDIIEKERRQEIDPELTARLTKNSSISSEKMLKNYSSDDPRIYWTTLKNVHGAQVAVETKLSEGFKKAVPILLILGVVMVAAIVMGNLPTTIDAIAKNFGVEKHIVTETVQKVEVVYLTPEEAEAQGIKIEETPPGINPDTLPREDAPVLNPVPEDVAIAPEDAVNNQRTEGFDVIGNLAPKIIPFEGSNNPNTQKTCDTENGYLRVWVPPGSDINGNERWFCLTDKYILGGTEPNKYPVYNGEPILEEDIGTYEVR